MSQPIKKRALRSTSSDYSSSPSSSGGRGLHRGRHPCVLPYPQPFPPGPPQPQTEPASLSNLPSFIRRQLNPTRCPTPPRPRPAIFYYIFTLVYTQGGQTRKFRHYLPCSHNVTYLAIQDTQKRQLFATGSHCMICPFCEEIQISHLHSNIFQCPGNDRCPKMERIPALVVDAKIEHSCMIHQEGMPHPNDLNSITPLPMPVSTPFQFTYHTTVTQDSVLLAEALYGRSDGTIGVYTPSGPTPDPSSWHRPGNESVLTRRLTPPILSPNSVARASGILTAMGSMVTPNSGPVTPHEPQPSPDEHDVSVSTERDPLEVSNTSQVDQKDLDEKLCTEVLLTDGQAGGLPPRKYASSPPTNP